MSVLFDFYESPDPTGEGKGKRYHARPVFASTVSTAEIVSIIHDRSSLSEGDILSTLNNLGLLLSEKLRDGRRVTLDGIGHFSLALTCPEIRTKKDMRADKVNVKSVVFRADKHLKSDMQKARMKRFKLGVHSARLSDEKINAKLVEYFKEKQILTRKDFQRLCEFTQSTAIRHIHRLLEEGRLKNINTTRNPIYVLGS